MDTVQPRPRGTLAPTVAASCPQLGIYQYGLLVPVYRDNLIDIPVHRLPKLWKVCSRQYRSRSLQLEGYFAELFKFYKIERF